MINDLELKTFGEKFVTNNIENEIEINELYRAFFHGFVHKFKTIYSSQFTFTTNDNWTQQHIDVFFYSLFFYGSVGVKKVKSSNDKVFEYVIYTPTMRYYDRLGNIEKATGILTAKLMPYWKKEVFEKHFYKELKHDVVFAQSYVLERNSPFNRIFNFLNHLAKLATNVRVANQFAVPKLLLKMTDGTKNSKHIEEFKDLVANVSNVILPISKTIVDDEDNLEDKNKTSLFGASQLKQYFFSLLRIIPPDQLYILTDQVDKNINLVYRILGIRQNVSFKKERQFSAEIDLNKIEYVPAEMEQKKQLQKFADKFNKIFNEKIKVVDNLGKAGDEPSQEDKVSMLYRVNQ